MGGRSKHRYAVKVTSHNSEGVEIIVHEMETLTVGEIAEYAERRFSDVRKIRAGLMVARSRRTGRTVRITYGSLSGPVV